MRVRGLAACAGVALCVWSAPARGGQPLPMTHGAMLDSVAGTVAAKLLDGATIPSGVPVRITTPVPGDTMGFVTQRLVERMRAAGVPVRLVTAHVPGSWIASGTADPGAGTALDSSGLDLALTVGASGVSYVRLVRSFPMGIRGYERLASVRASATLVDARTRDVLWARSATGRASDMVRKRDLAYAAAGSGGINPSVPRGSGTRLLEPLIVLGVVVGLVVLFYSNRT
jgi:hypothetical protein